MESGSYLSALNPEQLDAVRHTGAPLLILAGAGSGKTRVITTKIAWLIAECGMYPSSILAVTFTKKAAREMTERACQLEPLAVKSQIRTFHSFGSWFLRRHAQEAGVDPNFTVYDDDDMILLTHKANPSLSRQQASYLAHKISLAKDYCLEPESEGLADIDADPAFADMYEAYQKRLRETGNVDFGDLIMRPVLLMKQNDAVRAFMHKKFSVILVDEYQDSNTAQFELLQQLAGPRTYVCVVGDDDQSIYKFRGAEIRNILNFKDHFPGTDIIRLEKNYRSVDPILSIAGEVVAHNTARLGKNLTAVRSGGKKPKLVFLPNQDDETAFCAELITRAYQQGVPYSDWAILYRTNAQSLGFETEFLHRKIPYSVVGSLKFYEREEIKDILSYIAFIANRKDEIAFRRIVNKPARSVGAVTQDKIVEMYRSAAEQSLTGSADILETCRDNLQSLSKKAREGLSAFVSIVQQLIDALPVEDTPLDMTPVARIAAEAAASDGADSSDGAVSAGAQKTTLADFIERIVLSSGFAEYYRSQDEISGTQRVSNMQELVNSAALYPCTMTGLVEFLEHIELDRTLELKSEEDENRDSVTLITLHNTKGLEFSRVIITGLEYGIFPRRDKDQDEIEEERRLFYVGITRAKDELYMTSCAVRRMYGKTEMTEMSPFLLEISKDKVDVLGSAPYAWKRSASQSVLQTTGAHPAASKWAPGRTLYHDDYGNGAIIRAETTDGEYIITVQFETGAVCTFLPEYQSSKMILSED